MKWKRSFILVLITLIAILAIFFYKYNSPLTGIKEDIITYIEKKSNLNISYKEIKYWPLNRLIIRGLQLKKDGAVSISIPEVKIYYDAKKLVTEAKKINNSLKYITVKEPQIIITDLSFFEDQEMGTLDFRELTSGIGMEINGAQIAVEDRNNKFFINNLQMFLEDKKIEAAAGVDMRKISFSGYNIKDLEIDNMTFHFDIENKLWQGRLLTKTFPLKQILKLSPQLNKIDNLLTAGNGQALVNFSGFKSELQDYKAKIMVDEGIMNFNQPEFLAQGIINNIKGEIYFDSQEKELKFSDFNFTYCNHDYYLKAIMPGFETENPLIEAQISAENLQLANCGFVVPEFNHLEPAGKVKLDVLVSGELASPDIDLDIYVPEGRIGGEIISHFRTHISYRNKLLYLDSLTLEVNQEGFLQVNGLYNIQSEIYNFSTRGTNIDTGIIKKYFPSFLPDNNVSGEIGFDLLFNGQSINLANLNMRGKVQFAADSSFTERTEFHRFSTELWLAERKIMFKKGRFIFAKSEMDFSGEYDLISQDLDFKLEAENITPAVINNYLGSAEQFSGQNLNLTGHVTNLLKKPKLNIDLTLESGEINGWEAEDLHAGVKYEHGEIRIDNLRFNSQQAEIIAEGDIEITDESPQLTAELLISNVNCGKIADLINNSLPVRGIIDTIKLNISGGMDNPLISGTANAEQLFLNIYNSEFLLREPELAFSWQQDRFLVIDRLTARQNDAPIFLAGSINDNNLDLNFNIDNFNLSSLELLDSVQVSLSASGKINGTKTAPVISGQITADNIQIYDQNLQFAAGEFAYQAQKLDIMDFKWNTGLGEYYLKGSLENILTDQPYLELNIQTEKGDPEQIMALFNYNLPLQQKYIWRGEADISGLLPDLKTEIFAEAQAVNDSESYINLRGEVGHNIDIEIKGEKVQLAGNYNLAPDFDLNYATSINFAGKIKGKANKLSVDIDTEAAHTELNGEVIDKIKGNLNLDRGKILQIQQVADVQGNELVFDGSFDLLEESNLDLNIDLHEFPLEVVNGILTSGEGIKLSGYAQGTLKVSTNREDINVGGNINLLAKDIAPGFEEKINILQGELEFQDKEILLNDFSGQYAEQPFILEGKLFPFTEDSVWNIQLSGQNFPYTSGSIKGRFDPQIEISGPLLKPQLRGELLVHDLIIGIPFKFQNSNQEGLFQPEVDIVLKAGQDIYVRNQYLDIPVEEGSLRLSSEDGDYVFEGKVESSQGSFDYYNNKFILEKASADFRIFNENIPELSATAYTYVQGVKIYINISGLADNMLMTFYSEPELTSEEILNLLVSKGGLWELTSAGEGSFPAFIRKEVARFLRENFQLEFIKDLEDQIKNIFALDRIEIDTYELGINENISLYLEKSIGDRFNLQYERTFNLEDNSIIRGDERKFSFSYDLNKLTELKGSWLGEDEYRLFFETEIKF